MKSWVVMLGLAIFSKALVAQPVQLFHWWVSEGEQASIRVIQQHVEVQGLQWSERASVGSGTATFGDVLLQSVNQGRAPTASQATGD